MKNVVLISILCISSQFGLHLSAQSSQTHHGKFGVHVGYPITMLFDTPEVGIHLGLFYEKSLRDHWSFLGLIEHSYGNFERDETFFSQDGGSVNISALMLGLRLYANKPDKAIRFYLEGGGGLSYSIISEYNADDVLNKDNYPGIALGSAMGVRINNRFAIQLSYNWPLVGLIKVAYLLK